jgi:anti-anti-sigma factor
MSVATGSAGPGPAPLSIEVAEVRPRMVRISVAGEVDLTSAPLLREAVAEAISAAPEYIEIDLGAVRFLDSTGVAALVGADKSASAIGCRVVVTCPQPPVRRVLDIVGIWEKLRGDPIS